MLGVGSYTIPEAARLVGKGPAWVRRIIRGYAFKTPTGRASASPRLFAPTYAAANGDVSELTFNDLLELKFTSDFLEAGVSLHVIRRAAACAADMFGGDHPFLRYRFQTDGERIFAEAALEEGEAKMIDLLSRQHVFPQVMKRFLMQLDYREGMATRWFPLGRRQDVLLDPEFAFGRPIVRHGHVPTRVLAAAVKAGDPQVRVARWFEVPIRAVRAAVAFEQQLAEA